MGFRALTKAARMARRGKRLTRASAEFFLDVEGELLALERELLAGSWRPGAYHSFVVSDPKPRTISAAPFRDRVVHHAVCAAIGPALEALASDASCACRVGRGVHRALAMARVAVKGGGWFVKLDVRRYFETIDHGLLLGGLAQVLGDGPMLALCAAILGEAAPGSPAGKGLPIGNLTSQHFANFYLTPFDHWVAERFPRAVYVRYMDDLLFVVQSRGEARALEAAVTEHLTQDRRLAVKEEATRRGPVSAGVPFLGFRLWPAHIRLDRHRKRRLGKRLRAVEAELGRTGDEGRAALRMDALLGWAALGDGQALAASMRAERA